MREIKFRAWDKNYKRMIYPDKSIGILYVINLSGQLLEFRPRQKSERFCDRFGYIEAHHLEINNFILLQYTGLKDKNGKDIYEGDIVKFYPSQANSKDLCVSEVYWDKEVTAWQVKFGVKGHIKAYIPLGTIAEIEVIGNIYENYELLRSDQNGKL